jgi:hypothetical protein
MKKQAVMFVALIALLALPLAAQVPEENQPLPERIEQDAEEVGQEIRQEAEEIGQEAEQLGDEIEQEVDETFQTEDTFDDERELPRTASPFAALALFGLVGAGSALGVRIARRS